MIVQDNVLKAYLQNVYFVTGTPCGGKTTVSRALGEKHQIPVLDGDERFSRYRQMSDPRYQPSINRVFRNADEFFGRTAEEYRSWLSDNSREVLDFILLDLIRLSQHGPVLCDCHLTLEQARAITEPSRIVFLLRDPHDLVDDYCSRPDHQDFSSYIHSATDFEKAKALCNETLRTLNEPFYADVRKSGYFWIDRADGKSVDEVVSLVERHFGLIR
ncbi:MAG: shikimate kinase [Clostridia bacterium]|nr:shikimate kinase [Clostridia bacterium]